MVDWLWQFLHDIKKCEKGKLELYFRNKNLKTKHH